MQTDSKAFQRAMTLAALSGLKATLGPAFFAVGHRKPNASHWVLAAMGDLFLDKVGVFPSRFRLPLLIPHTLAGAWVAHESMKADGEEDAWAGPMGAVVAAGAACVAPMVRITANRVLGIPDAVLGVAEDYLALRLGTQAMDMQMNELTGVATDAFEDAKGHLTPVLESVGVNV
jgi:hypothetical protein